MKKINIAVIGASGYTGAELVKLLYLHPNVTISVLVADSNAGKPISDIFPHFSELDLPPLVKLSEVEWKKINVAFCCLPHGTSQEIIAKLMKDHKKLKVIDLSADFRIRDPEVYQYWYHEVHKQLELQEEAVYGLTEIYRKEIKKARLVACPGCYPTSMLLPLIPLLREKIIDPRSIIVDSKSGISGAGRSAKVENLFTEVNENVKPYGIGGHRHVGEVEQELSLAAGKHVTITFTPQVVPMNRGILSNIYAELNKGKTADDARAVLEKQYGKEFFVYLSGGVPSPRKVHGTNFAAMNVFADRVEGRIIIISAIDNLVKGASGQAVQNMNLMCGFDESEGLRNLTNFP